MLTMDGVGEWATTSLGRRPGNNLSIFKEIHFPHSLGLLYSAFTYYTGFKVNSGEYKLMGLAPYGEPKYASLILDKLIDINDDGSFWLDQSLFRLLHRIADDQREIRRAVRAAGAATGEGAAHAVPHGRRRLDPGGDRGRGAQAGARAAPGDASAQSVHGGRRCAQLRRQRQAAAGRHLRRHLDSAGRRRRGRRGGRGACRPSPVRRRCRATADARKGRHGRAPISGRASATDEIASAACGRRRALFDAR